MVQSQLWKMKSQICLTVVNQMQIQTQRKVLERKGMMQHEPPRISDNAVANLYVCMYGICVVQCGAAG